MKAIGFPPLYNVGDFVRFREGDKCGVGRILRRWLRSADGTEWEWCYAITDDEVGHGEWLIPESRIALR